MSYAGSATLKNVAKPRSSLLVHAYGHEVTGLKTNRGPKRKEQLGVCSLPGFYAPKADLTAPKSDVRFTPEDHGNPGSEGLANQSKLTQNAYPRHVHNVGNGTT